MVKAPVKASPGIRNNQPHHTAYQQQYPTPSVFVKVQHIDMGNNDTPSTSTGITNVSVIAVPTTSRATTASAAPVPTHNITKINQPQPTQTAPPPSVHVAPPPPPRLALHHVDLNAFKIDLNAKREDWREWDVRFHPMGAPMQMQHGPGPWPIVDPVFHFGPGFEHQHYCPTHSQGPQPHEHVVFFHVNAGVSVTFQIAGNREVIRGKFHFILYFI